MQQLVLHVRKENNLQVFHYPTCFPIYLLNKRAIFHLNRLTNSSLDPRSCLYPTQFRSGPLTRTRSTHHIKIIQHLHSPLETQQRVLHRDIKSANVLLSEVWEAKVSDFGLSKIGPANQEFTFLVSNAVGTPGYCDPLYAETGILTKESDVYSFGVVLFEVLCGRLCIVERGDERYRWLTQLAQRSYEEGKLDDIIFNGLREQMEFIKNVFFNRIPVLAKGASVKNVQPWLKF
ncbi:putative protein kinase RLK-Pelle-LRR-I-1 family [Helianthus annuus]|nr:putative protein kinase RLK-Pelle-LRR-I-1 family [Helianthus annuus]